MTAPQGLHQDKKKSSRWKLFVRKRRKNKQEDGENENLQTKSRSSPPRSDAASATSGASSTFLARIASTKRSDCNINVEKSLFPDDEPAYVPPNIAPTDAPPAMSRTVDTSFTSEPVKVPSLATSSSAVPDVKNIESHQCVGSPSAKTERDISCKAKTPKASASKSELKDTIESPTSVVSSVRGTTASPTNFFSGTNEMTVSSTPFSSDIDAFGFQDDDSWSTFSNPFPDVNAFRSSNKSESDSQKPLDRTPSPSNVDKPSACIHEKAPEGQVELSALRNDTNSPAEERKKALVPPMAERERFHKVLPDLRGLPQALTSCSEMPTTGVTAKAPLNAGMLESIPASKEGSGERNPSEDSPQQSLIKKMARARIAREAEEAKKAKCFEVRASPSSQLNSAVMEEQQADKKDASVTTAGSSKIKQLKEKRNRWRSKHSESSAPKLSEAANDSNRKVRSAGRYQESYTDSAGLVVSVKPVASGTPNDSESEVHKQSQKAGAPEVHIVAEQHDEFPVDEEPPKKMSSTSSVVAPAKEDALGYPQAIPLSSSSDTDSSVLRLMHSTSFDNAHAEVVGGRVQEDVASPKATEYHRQVVDKYHSVDQDDDDAVWTGIQSGEGEDSNNAQGDADSLTLDLTVVTVESCLKDEIEVVMPAVGPKDALDKFKAYCSESETASCTSLGDSETLYSMDDDTKSYTTDGSHFSEDSRSYETRSSTGQSARYAHGESKHARRKYASSDYVSDAESSYESEYDSEEDPVDSYFWESIAQMFVVPSYDTQDSRSRKRK